MKIYSLRKVRYTHETNSSSVHSYSRLPSKTGVIENELKELEEIIKNSFEGNYEKNENGCFIINSLHPEGENEFGWGPEFYYSNDPGDFAHIWNYFLVVMFARDDGNELFLTEKIVRNLFEKINLCVDFNELRQKVLEDGEDEVFGEAYVSESYEYDNFFWRIVKDKDKSDEEKLLDLFYIVLEVSNDNM